MRALVVHVGEGSTHILLATTRRRDLLEEQTARHPGIHEPVVAEEDGRHDHLYVMHDQLLRNGADLSLLYRGRVEPDLRQSLLLQAADAVQRFREMPQAILVAMSAGLFEPGAAPADDPLVVEFQECTGLEPRVLQAQDEALWMLRGVRGIYPSGELACAAPGHWRCLGAWEQPGRVPQLRSWEAGASRPAAVPGRRFAELTAPRDQPLFVTGELAWLAAALSIGLTFHDMDLLDETRLDATELERLSALLDGFSVEERNLIPMVGHQGDCLPEGLRLLRGLLYESGAEHLHVCSRGVAHGLASHLFYEGRRAAR